MDGEIVINAYEKKDRVECLHLLAVVPGTSDEETFKWRFESKAGSIRSFFAQSTTGNRVIQFMDSVEFGTARYTGYQSGGATHAAIAGRNIQEVVRHADQVAQRGIDFFGFRPLLPLIYQIGHRPVETYHMRFDFHVLRKRKHAGMGARTAVAFEDAMLMQDDRITMVYYYTVNGDMITTRRLECMYEEDGVMQSLFAAVHRKNTEAPY